MANYNKQFNFRNGVQVDDDNLVVSPTGLVGIGTTVPIESLDVRGNASITGFATAASLYSRLLEVDGTAGVTTVTFTDAIGAGVSISSGIVTSSGTGIVTFYGDARFLQGMPTSQWLDIDAGLGYTSIYAQGNVGIATDDPRFTFQIGGTADNTEAGFKGNSLGGVGISSGGDVLITGITTAQKFVGIGSDLTFLDADNITSGTVTNDRIPVLLNSKMPADISVGGGITASRFVGDAFTGTHVQAGLITATSGFTGNIVGDVVGNVTGDLVGDVTGTASTATSLTGSPDIVVGVLTANAVSASSFIGGITGDVTGNVTGNLTGTATTATALTDDAEVDIADMTVGVTTVSSFIGLGTDYLTGGFAIGGDTEAVISDDIIINRAFDRTNSGLTTTTISNASIKLWSDLGESTVTIGTSALSNGTNAQIRYGNRSFGKPYSTPDSLDFINYGDGNINYYLQAGTAGIGTGAFHWHNKQTRMMSLTYDGNLGIGLTEPPEKLHVAGTTRFTGESTFDSNVSIVGILSASSLNANITGNLTGDVTGNVRAQSGISTFNNLHATGQVGIGITIDDTGTIPFRVGPDVLNRFMIDDDGNVGIRTDTITTEMELHVNGDVKAQHGLVVGPTLSPKAAIDFSSLVDVVDGNTSRASIAYMIPPRLTTTQRNALTDVNGGSLGNDEAGAMIYNTTTNKLQVWNGSSWNDCF